MVYSPINGGENDEHNAIGFVAIYKTFATKDDLYDEATRFNIV